MVYERERERVSLRHLVKVKAYSLSTQWIILEQSWISSLEGNDCGTSPRSLTTLGHLSLNFLNTFSLTKEKKAIVTHVRVVYWKKHCYCNGKRCNIKISIMLY